MAAKAQKRRGTYDLWKATALSRALLLDPHHVFWTNTTDDENKKDLILTSAYYVPTGTARGAFTDAERRWAKYQNFVPEKTPRQTMAAIATAVQTGVPLSAEQHDLLKAHSLRTQALLSRRIARGYYHQEEEEQPRRRARDESTDSSDSSAASSAAPTPPPPRPRPHRLAGSPFSRDWCFTMFTHEQPAWVPGVRYICFQQEAAPTTGRLHWQGYMETSEARNDLQMREFLEAFWPRGTHVERRRGTREEAIAYCQKPGGVPGSFRECPWTRRVVPMENPTLPRRVPVDPCRFRQNPHNCDVFSDMDEQ